MFQTSEASEPNDVRVRPDEDQTARGIVAASDVEAVSTVAFVLASIVDTAEVIWEFVFALMPAASDEEAFKTAVLTPEIADANEVDAFVTSDCSANCPDVRFASVKSRVPKLQT